MGGILMNLNVMKINISIKNPLKTWWKMRMWFKRPKISISFFSNPIYNCPYTWLKNISSILDIWASDIMWKDKYNSPRHEANPFIWVCFFRKFGFSINFNIYYRDEFGERQNGSAYYWEYLLNVLEYHKSLDKGYSNWEGESRLYEYRDKDGEIKKSKYNIPVVAMSLNKRGIKQLKKEINERNRKH